jgi:flagellar biosynthesis component FlhA
MIPPLPCFLPPPHFASFLSLVTMEDNNTSHPQETFEEDIMDKEDEIDENEDEEEEEEDWEDVEGLSLEEQLERERKRNIIATRNMNSLIDQITQYKQAIEQEKQFIGK